MFPVVVVGRYGARQGGAFEQFFMMFLSEQLAFHAARAGHGAAELAKASSTTALFSRHLAAQGLVAESTMFGFQLA